MENLQRTIHNLLKISDNETVKPLAKSPEPGVGGSPGQEMQASSRQRPQLSRRPGSLVGVAVGGTEALHLHGVFTIWMKIFTPKGEFIQKKCSWKRY